MAKQLSDIKFYGGKFNDNALYYLNKTVFNSQFNTTKN